jgi:NAD-dependent DNA ligase
MILRANTDLSDAQIATLSDGEAWRLIYSTPRRPRPEIQKYKPDQVCFTGFSVGDKERLWGIAEEHGLEPVRSVTERLAFLVAGNNAGPSKLKKARQQECIIMTEVEFVTFIATGEYPVSNAENKPCVPSSS